MSESLVADALIAMTGDKDKYIITIEKRQQWNYTVEAEGLDEAIRKAYEQAEADNWSNRKADYLDVDSFKVEVKE